MRRLIQRLAARWRDRQRLRAGWLDAGCDNCDTSTDGVFHVLRARGRLLAVCASCKDDLRAAGAELLGTWGRA